MLKQANAGQPVKPGQTSNPTQPPKPPVTNPSPAKGTPSIGKPGGPQKPATK